MFHLPRYYPLRTTGWGLIVNGQNPLLCYFMIKQDPVYRDNSWYQGKKNIVVDMQRPGFIGKKTTQR